MPDPSTGGSSPATKTIANRYNLVQRTGEGALFVVYKALDNETGATVAVKMLRPALATNAAFASRMEAEGRASMALYHQHIAHVLDVVREGGALYIITEYVSGMRLYDRIQRTAPFPVAVAVEIAAEIADAMASAHAKGIVHGDIRPQNVMIGGDGHAKTTDFGLARSLESNPELEMNSVLRWVQCMAPEVGSGEPPTPASDTYSLGCILYHMLTGAPLFSGDNAIVVALKHAKDAPRSVRAVNPSIPPALDALVARSVQKNPADRYPDGAAIWADLKQIQDALRENQPLDWTPEHTLRPTTVAPPPVDTYVEEDEVPRYLTWIRNILLMIIGIGLVWGAYLIYGVFQPQSDVVIPELVGLTRAEAQQSLTDKGLLANVQTRESERPAEEVIRQDPAPGETVKPGRVIKMIVSKGPRMASVPAVTEMSLDRARELAEQAGLKVEKADSRHDEVVQQGYVIEQDPGSGEKVKPGKTIKVVVSMGPEPPPPPPPPIEVPPVVPDPTLPPPPVDTGMAPVTPSQRTGRLRSFNLRFRVPTEGYEQPVEVQIVVIDERGERIAVDEQRSLGEVVAKRVDAVGERVLLRVYMNGILFSEETR